MKIRWPATLLFFATIFFLAYGNNYAADKWDPKHTWVFFVGLVKWKDSENFASFPAEIRKDGVLLDSLRRHGVPPDQIVYLKDTAATTASVETKFAEFLKKPGADDWVFVYFEGHGYKTDDGVPYLATYDVAGKILGWKFNAVPDTIERYFKGSHAMIALDNCYSGGMANSVKRAKRRVSYAVLASSMASQESTGNWTFTESLISAFNGAAFIDSDHDGKITFAEMSANVEQDMLFGEEQIATSFFTGNFDPKTVIADASSAPSPRIGERVEAYSEDDWYRGFIVDVRGNKFKVHYYGYEAGDDEWVTAKMMRSPKISSIYKIGEKVEVEWKKEWFPAHIVNIKGGSHFVSYDDYDVDENEWVSSKRIRKIK
ncbi:MAG: agenet domain-containing protein [Pyrinomonadaceae bacterium]